MVQSSPTDLIEGVARRCFRDCAKSGPFISFPMSVRLGLLTRFARGGSSWANFCPHAKGSKDECTHIVQPTGGCVVPFLVSHSPTMCVLRSRSVLPVAQHPMEPFASEPMLPAHACKQVLCERRVEMDTQTNKPTYCLKCADKMKLLSVN